MVALAHCYVVHSGWLVALVWAAGMVLMVTVVVEAECTTREVYV